MLFSNPVGLFWRQQWILYLCLLATSSAAFLHYAASGERYEAYTLLRAGQGIKERSGNNNGPMGEGIDLQSRMESLSRIAKIDHVIFEAAGALSGMTALFLQLEPHAAGAILAVGKRNRLSVTRSARNRRGVETAA